MIHEIENRAARFLEQLEQAARAEWPDMIWREALETGGKYTTPQTRFPASHMIEISLHGVSGYGTDDAEAIGDWLKCARRQICEGATA